MRFVRFVVRNKYKLGVDYPIVGANCVRPPADFDVILCGRGFSPKTGTLLSAFADISPNRGITHHYAKKYIACVGGDDSAPRCRGGSPRPPVDFDVILPLRHALCACHLPNEWGGLRNGQCPFPTHKYNMGVGECIARPFVGAGLRARP